VVRLREALSSRELLVNLTMRELRGKYKGTILGWSWSMLNPLATMAVFTVVFGVFLRVQPTTGAGGLSNYALFLLCGLLPWNFLSQSMTAGMSALISNTNLIQKTYFPRQVLVIATVLAIFVSFMIEMVVLCVAFLFFGSVPFPWIMPTFVLMCMLAFFAMGIALLLSVANVYFRDSVHFVNIALQIWFYATPILYPLSYVESAVPPGSRAESLHLLDIYLANPMVGYVEAFRALLYEHRVPDVKTIAYLAVASAVAMTVGGLLFRRLEGRLAEEL
jgi:ABC-type polysaccharide/polyol phosphate export permease